MLRSSHQNQAEGVQTDRSSPHLVCHSPRLSKHTGHPAFALFGAHLFHSFYTVVFLQINIILQSQLFLQLCQDVFLIPFRVYTDYRLSRKSIRNFIALDSGVPWAEDPRYRLY